MIPKKEWLRRSWLLLPHLDPKIIFSVSAYYKALENTNFQELQKDIELHLKAKYWKGKDGAPLQSITLASKVNAFIKGFDHMKVSLENKSQRMQPISLTRDYNNQGRSQGSLIMGTPETRRGHIRMKHTN